MKKPDFFLCYFETTRQCDQGCPNCMTARATPPDKPELSTDEAKRLVLDELKAICPKGAVSFSGGERVPSGRSQFRRSSSKPFHCIRLTPDIASKKRASSSRGSPEGRGAGRDGDGRGTGSRLSRSRSASKGRLRLSGFGGFIGRRRPSALD